MALDTSKLRVIMCCSMAVFDLRNGWVQILEFGRHRYQFVHLGEVSAYAWRGRITAPHASHGNKAHR